MIRLLLVDDSKLVLPILRELIDLEAEFELVGTAENGQQGIEKIEQLQPDVAIIDLSMPLMNGIETTYLITRNYPETKVIVITDSDGQMLNEAISAGAKGYLLKKTLEEDAIAAIRAVQRSSTYIGAGVLEKVTLSLTNSQQLNSEKIDLHLKIEKINLSLAKEVVDYWHKHSSITIPEVEQIVENLSLDESGLIRMRDNLVWGGENKPRLIEELRIRVERSFAQIKDSADLHHELVEKQQETSDWFNSINHPFSYTGFLVRLRDNSQLLQVVTLDKLQKIISPLWQEAAPAPLLDCLQSVEKYLLNWQHIFEQERERNLAKESSALHSFYYLSNQLPQTKKSDFLNKKKLGKKAIMFIYQCRINIEIDSLLVQLTLEVTQQLRNYIDTLTKTDELLRKLKNQLQKEHIPEITLSQVFVKSQAQFVSQELRFDFENWAGHSLNQWGGTGLISESEIKERLLEKLRPIAWEIHSSSRKKF